MTECKKVPKVMCGPKGCGYLEGPEECTEKIRTHIYDKPEEVCKLDPRETCKFVTKLVPQLKEVDECIDVPREICRRSRKNPRKIKYPVVRTWCYPIKCPDNCVKTNQRGECAPECDKECCDRRSRAFSDAL